MDPALPAPVLQVIEFLNQIGPSLLIHDASDILEKIKKIRIILTTQHEFLTNNHLQEICKIFSSSVSKNILEIADKVSQVFKILNNSMGDSALSAQISGSLSAVPYNSHILDIGKNISEDISYPHLEGISKQALEKMFLRSYKKVAEMKELVKKLDTIMAQTPVAASKNIKNIRDQVIFWSMHYLDSNSVVTILNENQLADLPFWIYNLNNAANYYRGDGNVALDLCGKMLEEKYPFLNHKSFKFGLIANGQFEEIIHKVCYSESKFDPNYKYEQIITQELLFECISAHISTTKNPESSLDALFLDISVLLGEYKKPLGCPLEFATFIKEIMISIENALQQGSYVPSNPKIVVGGSVKIGIQEIFLLFPMGNYTQFFAERLRDFQSTQGIYPEIMQTKKALIALGFSLDHLICPIPINSKASILLDDDTNTTIQSVQEKLQQLQEFVHTINLNEYSMFLSKQSISLIQSMITIFNQKDCLEYHRVNYKLYPCILVSIVSSMQSIIESLELIKKIEQNTENSGTKFQKILQETYSMVDEIIYLQIFLKKEYSNGSLLACFKDKINSLSPSFHPEDFIQKQSFLFSSGIKCFSCITDSFLKMQGKIEGKLNALFLDTTYYELRDIGGAFIDYIKKDYDIESFEVDKIASQKLPDIIFLDLYPNYVTYEKKIQKTPIVTIVNHFLSQRETKQLDLPLIIVLDAATTLFFGDDIEHLVKEFEEKIHTGKVIFVVTSSLAKLFTCGNPKYTGGIVQVYSSSQTSIETFLNSLNMKADMDPLSKEALDFLTLLAYTCTENILLHRNQIRKNTDYVYNKLVEKVSLKKENAVVLGKKDENILMIGFSLKNVIKALLSEETTDSASDESSSQESLLSLTSLMQYYIYAQSAYINLPLHIRSSFAFLHSSITECTVALRLTIGLEGQDILDQYVDIIQKVNEELSKFLHSMNSENIGLLKQILEKDLENHSKPFIVQVAAGSSFIDFIMKLKDS